MLHYYQGVMSVIIKYNLFLQRSTIQNNFFSLVACYIATCFHHTLRLKALLGLYHSKEPWISQTAILQLVTSSDALQLLRRYYERAAQQQATRQSHTSHTFGYRDLFFLFLLLIFFISEINLDSIKNEEEDFLILGLDKDCYGLNV